MYSTYDYAYNGLLYLNNVMRPRHKRLSQLMIYSTTACQSQCKHCNIWQKKVEHLSLDDIRRIMQSKCITKRTTIGLEGGEFILHPQAGEIMAWFHELPSVSISPGTCTSLSTVAARLTSGCVGVTATTALFRWWRH